MLVNVFENQFATDIQDTALACREFPEMNIKRQIFDEFARSLASENYFDLAGIVDVAPHRDEPEELNYFREWIARGHAGEMEYLKRRSESGELQRANIHAALPWARTVIVCVANYASSTTLSTQEAESDRGWIARYAITGNGSGSPTDYHSVLLERMRRMEDELHARLDTECGAFTSRSYVDTGPIVERVFARHAGVGWIGKNTCLIHPELGSWLFLGVIVTSLELEEEFPEPLQLQPDRCGSCTRCIEACPTNALDGNYGMDASRCISYLTIEKRGPIDDELREGIGRQVFGCDICQDVCPWNERAARRGHYGCDPELKPRGALVNPSLEWLGSLTAEDFRRLFRGSPVERAKFRGLQRNVAIAMGNSGEEKYLPQLKEWVGANDAVIAEAAQWAAGRIEEKVRRVGES
jgi:epoxyqueuosine reductase